MILAQITYHHGNNRKQIMVVVIGERNDKLVCLLDSAVSQSDTNKIKNNLDLLSRYSLPNKIAWLKDNIPESYKKGFREIYLSRLKIDKKMSLKSEK